ncbi:MAG: GNAT family N-acetyltransferase [Proteobacteria bacterium]|nr:GNAT family N-acetyltransferase [Pseudomonadota bacterium]
MLLPHQWLRATLLAGRHMLLPAGRQAHRGFSMNSLVPIRALGAQHRERIAAHLLELSERDRYLRFGYQASDEQVQRYVQLLDFERDEVFGIFNRRLQLIAMAHVAFAQSEETQSCAEFGVSVFPGARGRGYGGLLFERAVTLARNRGVRMMFIHALTENTAMLRIARSAGATVHQDGSESQAYLQLPPAGLDTRVSEIWAEQFGEVDYQLKKQARQFWRLLADVQEIRQGVRDGRHQAAE